MRGQLDFCPSAIDTSDDPFRPRVNTMMVIKKVSASLYDDHNQIPSLTMGGITGEKTALHIRIPAHPGSINTDTHRYEW